MIFLYVLFAVYILAVNFYGFRYLKSMRDGDLDDRYRGAADGKLVLCALLGGSAAILASMFIMRYRLGDMILMIFLPLLAVVNAYCFYLGFRGIYYFF